MADIGPGAEFAGLRIEAVAGRGGMGVVYRATQLALNRTVAVKVVAPELADDPEFRERFKRESASAAAIDHPHVVPVYHAGADDGRLFVVMRFVDGTDLRELIHRHGALPPARVAEIVSQVASALDAAHARGLVHRDVKPANILIGSGARVHAYLTDFGLTKHLAGATAGLTQTGAVMGTVDYIAPEQLDGRPVDARVDVYALGCVLFEALTGRVPFVRDSDAAKMWAHMGTQPPALAEVAPHLPRELDVVVRRAMAKNPAERFATAGDLGRATLAAAVAAPPTVPAAPTGAPWAAPVARAPAADIARSPSRPPVSDPALAPQGGPSTPAPGSSIPPAASPAGGSAPPGPPPVPPGPGSIPPGPPSFPPGAPQPGPGHPGVTGPPRRAGRRTRAIVLSVAAVLLVAGLIAAAVGYAARDDSPSAPAATLVAAGEIAGPPVPTGKKPQFIVGGGGFLWTANGDDTISKIDPATGSSRQIAVGGVTVLLSVDQGAVWVLNYSDAVTRVDIASEQVSAPISIGPAGGAPVDWIAGGGGYLWLSRGADGTVGRLSLATLQVEGQPVRVGARPDQMWYGTGRMYVVNDGDGTVSVLDGATGQVVGPALPVAGANSIFVVGGKLYVASFGNGDGIVAIDEQTLTPGVRLPLPGFDAYTVGANSLWVNFPAEDLIRRYDLATFTEHGQPIRGVSKNIGAMEFIGGSLLVVSYEKGTVTRIRPTS